MIEPGHSAEATSEQKNWPVIAFLFAAPLATVGWLVADLAINGFHWGNLAVFAGMYIACGFGITAGYHRYYSHRAFDAHPILQFLFLIFGAASAQNALLFWVSNHRYHHRYTDTDLDPYDINKGFLYAHMGWMFNKDQPNRPFFNVADLKKDPMVLWQNRHYWKIVVAVGFLLPMAIGALYGRPLGGLLWGGFLRMVVTHHATFFVNSYAHRFGRKPYDSRESARDSLFVAIIALGEGWHNFHHAYPSDYRNGSAWYHWDPTKWFIAGLKPLRLTRALKRPARRRLQSA